MAFLDLPSRGVKMFYLTNPLTAPSPSISLPPPESGPLDPTKPILVLLHSPAASVTAFLAQFADPRLREVFNLVAFDARLHGRTISEDVPSHTIEDSADDLIAALDLLNFSSYSVFGGGGGVAQIAAWMAIKRPKKVVCIIVASPCWIKDPPQITESFLALAPWFCSNKDGQGDGTGTIPDPVVEILEDYFVGPQDRVKEYRTQHAAALRFRYGEGRSSHDALHLVRWGSHRVPFSNEQLASIKVPTLLLQGSADTIVSPLEAVKEWQERMTGGPGGAELRQVAGAPHVLSWTDANVVNRLVLAFLVKSNADRARTS